MSEYHESENPAAPHGQIVNSRQMNRTAISQEASSALVREVAWTGVLLGLLLGALIVLFAPAGREMLLAFWPDQVIAEESDQDARQIKREAARMEARIASLRKKIERQIPRSPYLIVDTSNNRMYLMAGSKQLREGVCSTGSYVLLKASGDRQWIFFTPRGAFRIQGKVEAPVWHKPDWAFVEEGKPIPPLHSPERYESGVLGEYALALGQGYLIHGTLYKRMLGMPVTHGCVRLPDEELRLVYQTLEMGSRVFIY